MTHKTVLLQESIDGLNIKPLSDAGRVAVIVDATINGGGHSEEMIRRYGKHVRIIGIDLDQDALNRAKERLEKIAQAEDTFSLHCSSFRNLDAVLKEANVEKIDGILFDLGLSSNQFEDSARGFTFQKDEPLLMSFKKDPDELAGDLTAGQIVNEWSEETLADIIYGYGEERYARRIARNIVETRNSKPIKTTFELVEIIRKSVPFLYTKGRTHFATRTFQALRITVNDEMQALREGLQKGYGYLKTGGRMSVISFHSIEDRIVKHFFREQQKNAGARIITKRPITPSIDEIDENRRARSAKLRILEK